MAAASADRLISQDSLTEREPAHPYHCVQFYRNDSTLIEQLGQFVSPAIAAGSAVILIATKAHRDALFARMRQCGPDFALAVARRRFVLLDADETLAKFMVKGQPDPFLFDRVIGGRMTQLAAAAAGPSPQIFAFGEMVASLWAAGKRDAAIQLEILWSRLTEKHAFQLLCAYPIELFPHPEDRDAIGKICAQHSHVIPPERVSRFSGFQDRLHSFLLLQQKSRALDTEIRERKKLQQALEDINRPLQTAATAIDLVAQHPELTDRDRQHLSDAHNQIGRVVYIVQRAAAIPGDND